MGEPPGATVRDICRGGGIKRGWERIVVDGVAHGSVFIARGLAGHLLVDQRFKRFCESEGITNCHLIPGESASRWF